MKKFVKKNVCYGSLLLALFFPGMSFADAFIGYLYPSGAKQGQTLDIIVGGQQMWGANTAYVTGKGVKVKEVRSVPGFNYPYSVQRRYIVAAMKARRAGKKLPVMPEKTADWRPHRYYDRIGELTESEFNIAVADFYAVRNSLQASPAINQKMLVTLQVDKDAAPGRREFRIVTGGRGVSNPIAFYIGKAEEVNEGIFEIPPKKQEIKTFTIPSALNGQIMPGGEVDKFLFQAKKGEVITFRVRAREFAPFLGDGVPGHFQPVAEVFDEKGKSIAFADDYFYHPDPILTFTVPVDGKYAFTIRDSIYRGRADFVYRVEAFYGKHQHERLPFPALPKDMKLLSKEEAQKKVIEENVRICGTLEKAKEKHSFRFYGKKGEKKILEVLARRFYSPLDASIIVTDKTGKILAKNDDPLYPKIGTLHHKADPYLAFTPPEDGIYTATVFSTDALGGKEYFYALRIDRQRPDFDIVLSPSAPNIAWSGARLFQFHIFPKEGFKGEIHLSVKGTDRIFFDGTHIIPAGEKKATLSLACKPYRYNPAISFRIEAKSSSIVKNVIPADEAMQAFAYNHFIPAENFAVTKMGKTPGEGRFFWRGKLLSPGRSVPILPPGKKGKKVLPKRESVKKAVVAQKKAVTPKKAVAQKKTVTPKKAVTQKKTVTPKKTVAPKKAVAQKKTVTPKKAVTPKKVIQKGKKRQEQKIRKKSVKKPVKQLVRKQIERRLPTRWIPPVYAKVDKVTLKKGGTASLKIYTILSPHDMTYSVTMENAPAGISIVNSKILETARNFNWEILEITLKADKNAKKGVFNQIFKIKMQYDASPDKNGDIHRLESLVPLPVLRMEVKE